MESLSDHLDWWDRLLSSEPKRYPQGGRPPSDSRGATTPASTTTTTTIFFQSEQFLLKIF